MLRLAVRAVPLVPGVLPLPKLLVDNVPTPVTSTVCVAARRQLGLIGTLRK